MPKKRHQTRYTKPPSTAPPSLSISSSQRTASVGQNERSVNDILAAMRRTGLNSSPSRNDAATNPTPSLPPAIRQILQLPETPAPRPRRAQRRDINGRRIPPGPPPPRSWLSLSQSRHAPKNSIHGHVSHIKLWPLPGAFVPQYGSLIDMTFRNLVANWDVQRDWNKFYLYSLPSRLRIALVYFLSKYHESGISAADLRLILIGPSETELAEYQLERPDPAVLNVDVHHLDLTGSAGRSISLKSLSELLFPVVIPVQYEIQDSWDAPALVPAPTALLPNLTHLSLAVDDTSCEGLSWKQLLSLSNKLSGLTHLNLSGWPAPCTTPNATRTKMVSSETGRSVSYSGTNMYSHALDDDWAEAISVLKRLSKVLYRLEYLDLTGCGDWFPALHREVDAELVIDYVDWAREWGKITALRLCSGYHSDRSTNGIAGLSHGDSLLEDSSVLDSQRNRLMRWKIEAQRVEKRIRTQRSGQGHPIIVELDSIDHAFYV
ncbi:hypothetical protein AB5N19_11245 [Seiridium cardinale]|uniref:Tafazzin n=1 Tax=Seiridium cardinale TaxID=138064 RepID=A0ABR2XSC8_9PEZI